MENRFNRKTFESTEFLLEAVEKPKIKAGASASSNILNDYFDRLSKDLVLLASRGNYLARRADRIELAGAATSAALLASLQSVSTRVDSASAYNQVMADIHSSFYINTVSTTAELSYIFGQATLPVQGRTDLLTQTDVYGNKFVSPEIELSYAIKATEPNALDYQVDPEAVFMIRDEQLWVLDATSTLFWVKLKAPLQYRGLIPNEMEIWPIPEFGVNILEIAYQGAGDSFSSSWTPLDLSYLPNYEVTSGTIQMAGPIRLHLPGVPISQIRIKIQPRGSVPIGIRKWKVYHTEYESSGTLVVKDPYSRTVGNTILSGKDPADLSLLTVTTLANQATINLTTTDSGKTPVITGVIMEV